MPDWIYDLPDAAILGFFAASLVAATAIAQMAGQRLTGRRLHESADSLSNAYRSVVTLAALVLALALVQAQTNLRDTLAAVRRESSVIDALDRQLFGVGTTRAGELRSSLRTYLQAIIESDWPAMATGHEAQNVSELLASMTRQGRTILLDASIPQTLAVEMSDEMDKLDDMRDARLTAALQRLPTVFWLGVGSLIGLAVVLAGAISWTLPHALGTIPPAAAIGILFGLTVAVDVPIRGQSAAQPTALYNVLHQMEKRL